MRVTVSGLGHRFPGRPWLFRGLDLDLRPGHAYALTGPSGSGKSTLLGLLAGWEAPSEGVVAREGVGRTGWVFQNPHGTPRRSAHDHVALPLLVRGLHPREADRRAADLLGRFGLGGVAQQQFRRLSGGEAQRLMLARAIASEPGLLLVDEPTAQLDLPTARTVNESLDALRSPGTIIVVATHDAATRDACSNHVDLTLHAAA
ncbi:ATP-binding cassette domain-containing protein [Cellulosimicrobium cellulans]|uniref:ABC transporter ATP-binding protein n=1 Tax=Cellulosimicrobium cellulans TaxID=1710 RepID=A0AAV5P5W5_CELCE|nr:ABC transporter [Cellulosimicrobium sp. TH-20]QDP73827.1 ATP-binding cassette domain-containing protein [Cellulosimicrobium cellulans]QUB99533.1 ATP-binding cassette domain-containing protein [Cellulosimicrobium cellulans]GLY57448.1 ABC transporter ATP-binding protein [Cellulosimicrobium cellulans]